MILVRLTHDFIPNAMLAAISDCFFFGHNAIVVRVPLLEIRQALPDERFETRVAAQRVESPFLAGCFKCRANRARK